MKCFLNQEEYIFSMEWEQVVSLLRSWTMIGEICFNAVGTHASIYDFYETRNKRKLLAYNPLISSTPEVCNP